MWRDFFRGKIPRHVANRNLVLVESELTHSGRQSESSIT
jgi:hypothetical protein